MTNAKSQPKADPPSAEVQKLKAQNFDIWILNQIKVQKFIIKKVPIIRDLFYLAVFDKVFMHLVQTLFFVPLTFLV